MKKSWLLIFLCMQLAAQNIDGERAITVIIPSYNNAQWYTWNLGSVVKQDYSNFKVIYIDDCSTDGTADLVEQCIARNALKDKVALVRNHVRVGALENLYNAIHACSDDMIIVLVDGDDALARPDVLRIINDAYASSYVWLTYGQYLFYPQCTLGCCESISDEIICMNNFRSLPNVYSHLRTFYAGLFKRIKKEDLMHEGKFFQMTWDTAMMVPMLEMAGDRFKFIEEPLYLYNTQNPLSDFRIDRALQVQLEQIIRNKRPYKKLRIYKKEKS